MNHLKQLLLKSPSWALVAAGVWTINLTPSLAMADDQDAKITASVTVRTDDDDKTPDKADQQTIIIHKDAPGKEDADDDDDDTKADTKEKKIIVRKDHSKMVKSTTDADARQKRIVIREIDPTKGMLSSKKVTWLGVAVGDVSEALTSQLSLKPGEGLLVTQISPESPAAKAELKNHDVLVDFDGQMLVDPTQLRKLVQMHSEGDEVKVTFFRGGKKQTVTAKLAKTIWEESSIDEESLHGHLRDLQLQLGGLNGLHDGLENLAVSLKTSALDKQHIDSEVRQTMEQTRKAIQDAVKHAHSGTKSLAGVEKELEALAGSGMDVDKDATVVVRNAHNSTKTIVKTDDGGSYIIVANPKRHLTARDKDGKTLFDGPIETAEQQKKVPQDVWEKVKPMMDEVESPKANESENKKETEKP